MEAQGLESGSQPSFFDISAVDIDGQEHRLADLAKDKKCVLVVNVASK